MTDLLSAISVLLVFLTFLFNGIEKEINEKLSLRKPDPEQQKARSKFNNELYRLLFLKTIPVTLIYLITFYCLLPTTIEIITKSNFSIWHFDALKTIFVFIAFGLLGLGIYAIIKTGHLIKFIRQ
jgi:hypothetical protein